MRASGYSTIRPWPPPLASSAGSFVSVFEPPSRMRAVGRRPADDGRADAQRAVLERHASRSRCTSGRRRRTCRRGPRSPPARSWFVKNVGVPPALTVRTSRPARADRVDRGAELRAGLRAASGRSSGRRSAGPGSESASSASSAASLGRLHAGAREARVDLDEEADLGARRGERRREAARDGGRVADDRDVAPRRRAPRAARPWRRRRAGT